MRRARPVSMRLRAAFLALVIVTGGLVVAGAPSPAKAETRPFDFYVLALSWSPTWCELEGGPTARQCSGGRDYGFIVHGLWPQFERGYPEFCGMGPSQLPDRTLRGMLDIMPDRGLVRHQWSKHGRCSGLSPQSYFDAVRRAAGQVAVPVALRDVGQRRQVDPDAVERAFRQANPGLPAEGIAVTCDRGRLEEVRICMTRELGFRRCPEVDRRSCRAASVTLPATR